MLQPESQQPKELDTTMLNPIAGVMNAFGFVFSIGILGFSFYGGLYLGVKSQTNPFTAPIVRSFVLGEDKPQQTEENPVDSLLDRILK